MNFSIGLSGLRAAQSAINIIGTNLSNAATQGYHRQEVKLTPVCMDGDARSRGTGGVRIQDVQRKYDVLLERETLRQLPSYGQTKEELAALKNIESVLGQVKKDAIQTSMNKFFSAMNQLGSDPNSFAYRQEAVRTAQQLCSSLNNASDFLEKLKEQAFHQAKQTVSDINQRLNEVAEINGQIEMILAKGGKPNLLLDKRDKAIADLAELGHVIPKGLQNGDGNILLQAWGTPVVSGSRSINLDIQKTTDKSFGIGPKNGNNFSEEMRGGKMGGLLEVYNKIIPNLQKGLDTIAKQIMFQVNKIHAQGVGKSGSFTRLTGNGVSSTKPMSEWGFPPVKDGKLTIRLTSPTGEKISKEINVLKTDTVPDLINKIKALNSDANIPAGTIDANVVDTALSISTANGWKFDFVPDYSTNAKDPAVLAGTGGGAGSPKIEFAGIYTGKNQNYSFEVSVPGGGQGKVGITKEIKLTVKNQAGETVKVVDIGKGYAEGDSIKIQNGFVLKIKAGTLNHGEKFTVTARSDTDSSNVLAALGMNTIFTGKSALDIAVSERIAKDPLQIAAARGSDGVDSSNAQKIFAITETNISEIGTTTIGEYHRDFMSSLGQLVLTRKSQVESAEIVKKQLSNQRDKTSGVDVNEEAAKLMIYEKMFQAMSKFISTQNDALKSLMQMI